MDKILSKEEVLDKCMPDLIEYPNYGLNNFQEGVVYEAMDEYAKLESVAFGKFCVDNAWRIDKLVDTELTYNGLHKLYEIEKLKTS